VGRESPYSDALERFANQTIVTVGCGETCACLGDERNLREFLVADETTRRLREAGHAVISLLVNDSLDPLNERQLRVAVDKSEFLVEKWSGWCGYIDETQIEGVDKKDVKYRCRRCEKSGSVSLNEVKGKLNWKLDCAVRWVLLNIDAEPFNKSYLEPQSGSFVVAQEISKTYFGGHDVLPLRYGLVQIDKSVSYRLLPSLPEDVLCNMFTDRATAYLRITPDYVMNIASRSQVDCGLSYLECVKQLVPMWLLRQHSLTDRQRDLTARGIRFAEDFLDHQVALRLPSRASMQDIHPITLSEMHRLMVDVLRLREHHGDSYEEFCEPAKQLIESMGENKHEIMVRLRAILGQKTGTSSVTALVSHVVGLPAGAGIHAGAARGPCGRDTTLVGRTGSIERSKADGGQKETHGITVTRTYCINSIISIIKCGNRVSQPGHWQHGNSITRDGDGLLYGHHKHVRKAFLLRRHVGGVRPCVAFGILSEVEWPGRSDLQAVIRHRRNVHGLSEHPGSAG